MNEYVELLKAVSNLSFGALLLIVVWRIVDKWAGKFLGAQDKQAEAMVALATAVQAGQGDQREMLLAMRVMATKLDEMREWLHDLALKDHHEN